MDNNITLPLAPDIDHVTPEIIEEWVRPPEFVDDKGKWVTRVGQIVVQRDRVSESENGYAFLDYAQGRYLFRYDGYSEFSHELRVTGEYETRKTFHELMLAIAAHFSRLTDYAQVGTFSREQTRELGARAREILRIVPAEFDWNATLTASTYDESHDVIPEPEEEDEEEEVEKAECDNCGEDFERDDLSETDVAGDTQLLCSSCREQLNACDECGYTSFSEYVFNGTDSGECLCDDCYREYMTKTCDECGETSTDEDDFEDYNGLTLCHDCARKAEYAEEGWTPATWLRKNEFEEDECGFIVYKSFGKYYPPPEEWSLTEGSIIESEVMSDLDIICGYGINVADFAWVRQHSWQPSNTWKCRLHNSDIETTVIPYGTDGKFRVARLELLNKVDQDGNRLADEGYTEDDD